MKALLPILERIFGERETLNRWFRVNASANRDLPWTEQVPEIHVVHENADGTPIPVPQNPPVTPKPPPPKDDTKPGTGGGPTAGSPSKWPSWAWPLILAGAIAASGIGGAAIWNWWTGDNEGSTIQPSGSLLQYLQDEGYHIGGSEP